MSIRLEPLGPQHAPAILEGQDEAIAREISGCRWDAESLSTFLARCARWREDGPIREYAALPAESGRVADGTSTLIGGAGLNTRAPGLTRNQATMTYWLLAAHRGQGDGHALASAVVEVARTDPKIHQLVLLIAPANAASLAVAHHLGATATGHHEPHPADATRTVERWTIELR
ncbi:MULTISPECIES: GNAT family N-acetyltransferase [unclassified Brachybacterium]|uniref:GNAT family N-acetyltransferase n=1 Tax=unclassified Brachybacterium TaxID=2623841 RepID=UPI003621203C